MKFNAQIIVGMLAAGLASLALGCGPELECDAGERICVDNVSRTCVYGSWVDVKCESASPVCDIKHGCVQATSNCGNGSIDVGEACDKENLANRTCADLIQGSTGTLRCLDNCQYDTNGCSKPEKVCTDDEKRCEGTELQKCSNNAWITSIDCASINQMICDSQTLSCITGCQGEPRCSDDGKSVISCKSGEESIESCASGTSCKLNGSGEPECMQ